MKKTYLFLLIWPFFCGQAFSSLAQGTVTDSSSQQVAFNNAVSFLNTSLGTSQRLYNGPEYYLYDPLIKGNAYFQDVNTFTTGSVYYDGVLFTGVPMLYDIYKDEVAVLLYNHFSRFSLLASKLGFFNLLGHHFININADIISSGQVLKSGIYDQIYNGNHQVLAKRLKDIQTNTSNITGPENYFNTRKSEYFISIKGNFYTFSSQNTLLEILKDQKKQLQRFIKSGHLRYRKDPENVIVKIVAYYDQLN